MRQAGYRDCGIPIFGNIQNSSVTRATLSDPKVKSCFKLAAGSDHL